jgi:hypothetical protein
LSLRPDDAMLTGFSPLHKARPPTARRAGERFAIRWTADPPIVFATDVRLVIVG